MELTLDPILFRSEKGLRKPWRYRVDARLVPGQRVFVEFTANLGVWQISFDDEEPSGRFQTAVEAPQHLKGARRSS